MDLSTADGGEPNVIAVYGQGEAIRNSSVATVAALGLEIERDGAPVSSPYRIEDLTHHAMDDATLGLVVYREDDEGDVAVYVTAAVGSIQQAVNVVPLDGTVNVEQGDFDDFDVGGKSVVVRFEDGPEFSQWETTVDGQFVRQLSIIGTEAADQIMFSPGNAIGEIVADVGGWPKGAFLPTGRLFAYGLGGNDVIHAAGSIELSVWLYGGMGNDRLKGGAGHDVLLGGDDDDLLVGGSGRDLLIGGTGADRVVGNADDDILIAGYTIFDSDPTALDAIMDEWIRTDILDQQRIDNLKTGVGPDGLVLLDNSTVLNDGVADILTGSAGLDWFWFDEPDDHDRATDLKDEIFTADLDWILAEV